MIELCANGEKTLERFRYQFPDDWLYSDQLRGEWSAYQEILKRKNDSIQEQLGMMVDPYHLYALLMHKCIQSRPSAEDCSRGQDSREQNQRYTARVGTHTSCAG